MSTERAPINVLLRSEQSEEHIAVMDNTVGAGFSGPPLHHHDFDETFYVLEGELTFQLEDEVFTRTRGELAFAPRNVPHTFANLSGADARTLIICTPAGFGFGTIPGDHRGRPTHRRAGPRGSTKQPEGAIVITESDREPSPMPHREVPDYGVWRKASMTTRRRGKAA